jgi:RNA polymerase sigma-70 factor (ECF subfamily)
VKAAFDRLPENFRTLVLLVYVEGLTYREAAEALNVPVGTVMSRLSRARGLLRLELARHAPESSTRVRREMDLSAQRRVRS